jgi:hypothetical protein
MFARSQTFVCLQANNRLAIGKNSNEIPVDPRYGMNGSSKDNHSPREESSILP